MLRPKGIYFRFADIEYSSVIVFEFPHGFSAKHQSAVKAHFGLKRGQKHEIHSVT